MLFWKFQTNQFCPFLLPGNAAKRFEISFQVDPEISNCGTKQVQLLQNRKFFWEIKNIPLAKFSFCKKKSAKFEKKII